MIEIWGKKKTFVILSILDLFIHTDGKETSNKAKSTKTLVYMAVE